ncbi:Acyl-CoA synthetase short-chain member 3, mitochondrial [Chamberlinius hualienensis]
MIESECTLQPYIKMKDYQTCAKLANENYEKYWEKRFQQFSWFKRYTKVLDNADPNFPKWFPGGEMNFSYECLDKHVNAGHGDDIAFIFDSFYTKIAKKVTYREALEKVSKMAGSFRKHGVQKQDRILLYLPTTYETIICMLAACRIGAVYTVLYGGFSDEAIADRIDDFKPKIIVTANDDHELGHSTPMKVLMDKAIELAKHKPTCCFIWQRPEFDNCNMVSGRDFDLHEVIENGQPQAYVPVEVNLPVYVVYTSGTTGKPKGVVHCTRGLATACIPDNGFIVNPDLDSNPNVTPITWITSNFAWIAGQFAGCFMALMWKVTSLIYEGAIKDLEPEEVYRVISTYRVTSSFISTQSIRALMAKDPNGNKAVAFKPFQLQILYGGGVGADVPTITWAEKTFEIIIMQFYGQTGTKTNQSILKYRIYFKVDIVETGGLVAINDYSGGKINCPSLSVGKPIPGYNVKIIKEDGREAKPNEPGRIMIKMPLPPTMMVTILNNDKLFVNDLLSSRKGYYDLKDDGKLDSDGNLYVLCRSDTVFKVGGHRISCTGIEEAMMAHPDIAECVVVTKLVTKKGVTNQIPEGFFITKSGVEKSYDQIAQELLTLVHRQIGSFIPMDPPHRVIDFPRTVSGKISRSIVEKMLRNPNQITTSIESDPIIRSLCESIRTIRG